MTSESRARSKVLIVDDRRENLFATAAALRRLDAECITATSGADALSLLLRHEFALILMDVQMPEMNGFEAAALIRANPSTQHIPIIFVTAISKEDRYIAEGYEQGAVDYLFKPVDPQILRSKVRVFLELHEQRVRLEEMIVQQQEQGEALARANAELARARDEALAASQAKSRFLATMSHEIRTPLGGVIGLSELLEQTTELRPEQRQYVALIHNCGENLLALVNDILDFSKNEAGHLVLEAAEFDLCDVVEGAAMVLSGAARRKGLALSTWIRAPLPRAVVGDPVRLRQVLINFLSNATKFTEEGEISVQVTAQGPVTDGAIALRFEVSDTGIGLDDVSPEALFEPFVQADASMARRYGGTGLGLAICTQLVHAMGGQLGARANDERGSTFWFTVTLPVVDAEPGTEVLVDRVHHAVGGGPRRTAPPIVRPPAEPDTTRILVVDDSQVNRLMTSRMLADFVVETVASAEEALTRVREVDFDLVLMDCQLPGMDGFEATRQIRRLEAEQPGDRRVPVVALTAHAAATMRERCLAAGMDDYLAKPFKRDQLQQVCLRWLDR